jgi:hypothetical protein
MAPVSQIRFRGERAGGDGPTLNGYLLLILSRTPFINLGHIKVIGVGEVL